MFEFHIEDTPNPNAKKYIFGFDVIKDGKKASFLNRSECDKVPLAATLMDIEGVEKLHFFDNFITVTKLDNIEWSSVEKSIHEVFETMIDSHDPNIEVLSEDDIRKMSYKDMPEEIREINEVLDRTVRPYLQMDGGDVQVLKYDEEKRVFIHYEGACGGCPISSTGTLQSIEGILKDELDEDIAVVIV